jgi:drug/metabolite transporter (DMT)-like permease
MLVNRDFSMNAEPKGVALLFLAVFSAVGYSFFIKKLANKYKAITILFWQNVIGAVYFFPLFMMFDFKDVLTIVPSLSAVMAIVQLALFASSLAFLLFIIVVAKLGMVRANIFTNLIPVFTAFFAYFIIGEIINLQKVIGIFLVITGIVISQLPGITQIYIRNRQKMNLTGKKQ